MRFVPVRCAAAVSGVAAKIGQTNPLKMKLAVANEMHFEMFFGALGEQEQRLTTKGECASVQAFKTRVRDHSCVCAD